MSMRIDDAALASALSRCRNRAPVRVGPTAIEAVASTIRAEKSQLLPMGARLAERGCHTDIVHIRSGTTTFLLFPPESRAPSPAGATAPLAAQSRQFPSRGAESHEPLTVLVP